MTGKSRLAAEAERDESGKQSERFEADAEKIRNYEKMAGPQSGTDDGPPAEEAPATVAETESEDPQTALKAARAEAAENYDRCLRVSAEFENFKKRTSREMADFRKYAVESLVSDMLPVVDNLERAIASAQEGTSEAGILEGIRMTLDEMRKVFAKVSVEPVEAVGKVFDPAVHQAVMQEETSDHPDKTVMREFQKGYTIHGRLLRPAMVVVAKAKSGGDGDSKKN